MHIYTVASNNIMASTAYEEKEECLLCFTLISRTDGFAKPCRKCNKSWCIDCDKMWQNRQMEEGLSLSCPFCRACRKPITPLHLPPPAIGREQIEAIEAIDKRVLFAILRWLLLLLIVFMLVLLPVMESYLQNNDEIIYAYFFLLVLILILFCYQTYCCGIMVSDEDDDDEDYAL